MKLIVCQTYEQKRVMEPRYPNDLVIVQGGVEAIGMRFDGIVDLTSRNRKALADWWRHVEDRVEA